MCSVRDWWLRKVIYRSILIPSRRHGLHSASSCNFTRGLRGPVRPTGKVFANRDVETLFCIRHILTLNDANNSYFVSYDRLNDITSLGNWRVEITSVIDYCTISITANMACVRLRNNGHRYVKNEWSILPHTMCADILWHILAKFGAIKLPLRLSCYDVIIFTSLNSPHKETLTRPLMFLFYQCKDAFNKHSIDRSFETPWRVIWRHRNAVTMQ